MLGGSSGTGSFAEMQKLEKMHIQLHETVKHIISLKTEGKAAEAEKEFTKITPISDEIVDLLTLIEQKVKTLKTA